jgi:hypothetical protein
MFGRNLRVGIMLLFILFSSHFRVNVETPFFVAVAIRETSSWTDTPLIFVNGRHH